MATGSICQDKVRVRAAAASGAILAHAAMLVPLALGALGLEFRWVEDNAPPTLMIQLEAWPALSPPPVVTPPARASIDRRAYLSPAPLPPRQMKPLPDIQPAVPPPAEAARTIDARWRVRPSVGGPGWGDCPEAFSTPSAQNICNERNRMRLAAAESRPSEAPAHASTLAPDPGPNGAFGRTAAANQAWRDYTRNDGPYPGLRSLLRDH